MKIKSYYIIWSVFFVSIFSCSKEEPITPIPGNTAFSVKINSGNSNMPTGGTVISQYSDSPIGNDVGKVADNNLTTKFVTPNKKVWLIWKGDSPSKVLRYSIISANDAPDKDPAAWVLSASNDSIKWTILDSQSNQKFADRGEEKEYSLKNASSYFFYKLEMSANNGVSSLQLAEWKMKESEIPVTDSKPFYAKIASDNINMPTGGIITSQYSDSPPDNDIRVALDNNPDTKFITPHDKIWLVWKGDSQSEVESYSITSAGDSPQKGPKSWVLSASTDSIEWKVLDSRYNQKFSSTKEEKEFFLYNSTSYLYYKLEVFAQDKAGLIQIAEWKLKKTGDIDDLIARSEEASNGHSDITPMGSFFENRHVTTESDRVWLKNSENEPPNPPNLKDLIWKVFDVDLYPYGEPSPADINQHNIGDCGGIAAIASMAYVHPDFIKKIIRDNRDGTYTISMYDPQGNPVEVSISSKFLADKSGNIAAVSGKNNKAAWSTILEKAIMKYNVIYQVNPNIEGIVSDRVIPLFTGDGTCFGFTPNHHLSTEELFRVVKTSLRKGKFITGGFKEVQKIGNTETVTLHGYTLMHSKNADFIFAMRNPWGFNPRGDGRDDGVLDIPKTGNIYSIIDLWILEPGKAGQAGRISPYTPPVFAISFDNIRLDKRLLQGMRMNEN
ncbi:MAG TPA: hypothetical protein DDZ96_05000 [Porphyromonadaceae bacterium]|jgi:hypothetical protein|nr:hypothetical protein [Porphyromonadaceae bacterium]HBX21128.1 hypothetical protein [Porphyromonadaceae bacterium]HCM21606.1 hypothetical protein [Porphyromonadaceae bacterium]